MNRQPRTPEQRARVSATMLGRKRSRDAVLAIGDGHRGIKASPEARANMRLAKLGRKATAEQRAAMRAGIFENECPTKTPEHRAAIAAAKQGKPWTDAQRAGFERAMERRRAAAERRAQAPQ